MALPTKVYLDSNAIIRFAESDEEQIANLYQYASGRNLSLFTSELTLAEVLVAPIREKDDELATAYKIFLRSDPILKVVPVDRPVLERSAELRARYGGKGPDAIHCATADLCGCEVMVSSDKRLRLPEGILRVAVEEADTIGSRA